MSADLQPDVQLEIGHVLAMDVVGYSKLLIHEQSSLLQRLNELVRGTNQFRAADAEGKLIRLPAGDGMILVFLNDPEAPIECAMEIAAKLKSAPEIPLRIGIHSGPVNEVLDVNERRNVAGAGIDMAQRVMDCGDAGHILLSKRVADDLTPYSRWNAHLHDLGECEVKHGRRISLVNFYEETIGNPAPPEKLRRQRAERRRVFTPARVLLSGALVLAVLGAGLWFFSRQIDPSSSAIAESALIPVKSIAVLPFANLSEEKANAYFAEGIQDEILTRLSKIADLKVISRTSTLKYKSSPANLREIAQQLGVTHILEGSVQRATDQVRITVQLINALTDSHLWADTYDRKLEDVFQMETEVAEKIAASLEAKLTGRDRKEIAAGGTKNPEAYDAYLQGLSLIRSQSPNHWLKGRDLFRRAVELDPNYADAWTQLGMAESLIYSTLEQTQQRLADARRAVDNAVRLQPDLGMSYAAQGIFYYYCLRDFRRAVDELERARRALPNNSDTLHWLGLVKRRQGKMDEAVRLHEEALKLDPLNAEICANLARSFRALRRFEDARKMFARSLAIMSDDLEVLALYAETYAAEGDLARAEQLIAGKKFDPGGQGFIFRVWLFIYKRQFEEAINFLEIARKEPDLPAATRALLAAVIADIKAQSAQADAGAMLRDVRQELEALRSAGDRSPVLQEVLVRVLARLKDRNAVETEARTALDMTFVDQMLAPRTKEVVASAYAILGDANRALSLLQDALTRPCMEGVPVPYLRIDPVWDNIRNDPRFQKLAGANP
jgi:TolB-like protein